MAPHRNTSAHKLVAWVYVVNDKAAIKGVRLKPRGAVYRVEEVRALITMNPGAAELRMLAKKEYAQVKAA